MSDEHDDQKQESTSPPGSSGRSPVGPLAPLEYLQRNQRRGSITDPSLHTSSTTMPGRREGEPSTGSGSPGTPGVGIAAVFEPKLSGSTTTGGQPPLSASPRPASAMSFGRPEGQLPPLRSPGELRGSPKRLARTVVEGAAYIRAASGPPDQRAESKDEPGGNTKAWLDSHHHHNNNNNGSNNSMNHNNHDDDDDRQDDSMDVEHAPGRHGPPARTPSAHDFDYSMRRHSIAAVHTSDGRNPHLAHDHPQQRPPYISGLAHGVKRKNSADHSYAFNDQHPPYPMHHHHHPMDTEGPAPTKRRMSAFDTQKIAQLSLYDRRDSIDSRSSMGAPQWWAGDRRDSTTSVYSNASSVGGYTSATSFSPDSHAKPYGQFNWEDGASPMQGVTARQLPPAPQPAQHFVTDRRMSAPDTSKANGSTRTLRSRSRPPSSSAKNGGSIPQINVAGGGNPQSGDDGSDMYQNGTENGANSASPAPSPPDPGSLGATSSSQKDSTPYSRSPELRVSHKLAERKRRKEMKDLFDELRDQLPADRGMKASKWEILSKAVDYINTLRVSQQEMAREVDGLRRELEATRATAAAAAAHPGYGPPPLPPYSGSLPVGPYSTQQQHPSHARATAHPAHPYPPHAGPPPSAPM